MPTYLSHYTSLGGLLGILNSKSIWASDITSLNDKKEIVYAKAVLVDVLENMYNEIGIGDSTWFQSIAFQVHGIAMHYGRCICSFCEQRDQLSLWRPYAADGQGASIEFRTDRLKAVCMKQGFDLKQVIYDKKLQNCICRKFLCGIFERYGIGKQIEELPEPVMMEMNEFVNSVGLLFKNPGFSDEREWRLISYPIGIYCDRWQYRAAKNMIIPYLAIDLNEFFKNESTKAEPSGNSSMLNVTIGPRVHLYPTAPAIEAISENLRGRGRGVSLSSIPYRG